MAPTRKNTIKDVARPAEAPCRLSREVIRRLVAKDPKLDLIVPSIENVQKATAETNREHTPDLLPSEVKQEQGAAQPAIEDTEPYTATPDEDESPKQKEQVTIGPPGFQRTVKPLDRLIPYANVGRIMNAALPTGPHGAKIGEGARECMQECVSEFISFITSEAAERAKEERRKTITGEDFLSALTTLGFEHYAETLTIYLAGYREQLEMLDQSNAAKGAGGQERRTDAASRSGHIWPEEGTEGPIYQGIGLYDHVSGWPNQLRPP